MAVWRPWTHSNKQKCKKWNIITAAKSRSYRWFFFTNVSNQVSPSKESFCLLCVGACSLARTPATAIKSLHAETFLFLEFVVCLLSPPGKISFQSVEELMFFLYHPNSAYMCNLKRCVCFSFTPQDPVKKTKVWFHCCVTNYLTKTCFHRHSSAFLESALFNIKFKYVFL